MHITIDKGALLNVLTKILPKPQSGKLIIDMTLLDPGETRTLLSETSFNFAVILIEGNGDPEVTLEISIGEGSYRLMGNEQTIMLVANESVSIEALNNDTTSQKTTPRIQIAYITW
jgi:hypothetical protein